MSGKNVLLVEDDAILLFVNEKLLNQLGYKVVAIAKTADQAVEAMQKFNPDIILMDIRLIGDKDGIDAMEEIRQFSNVPVVYLSGNSEPATLERAKKTNMRAFLIKPVSIEMLENALLAPGS